MALIKNSTEAILNQISFGVLPKNLGPMIKASNNESMAGCKPDFENVPLITHEGDPVLFYDDLLKNKTVLINFMYVRCAEICPAVTQNLKRLKQMLGDRVGKDVFMYSITLEPERDTQQILKAYVEHFNIESDWLFLTGRKENIDLIRQCLGLSLPDPDRDKDNTQHVGILKYGIEPLQRWGICSALSDPKHIAEYLYWMEPSRAVTQPAGNKGLNDQ